jgi:hypothetical protein
MGKLLRTVLLGLSLLPGAAAASWLAELEVYDRTDGRLLPVHEHRGQRYVAGTPGHEYELRLRNAAGERVLAVTSVDGVNVVTGETAATGQGGYVLGPYQSLDVGGWRKSLEETAAFYFTRHRNSYAVRTGRPFDVGVIGVALFREKRRCCDGLQSSREDFQERDAGAPAPSADAAEPELRRQQREEKLGTGHGRREHSPASYAGFERASDTPDQVLAIYYDTRENLVAQGVIPRDRQYAQRRGPRPFPGGFVPDP